MPDSARITVGVPVYRGRAFVAETLRSIVRQTFPDFKAIVSVDGADADSASVPAVSR